MDARQFGKNPTPLNAVLLAIADHKAFNDGAFIDWQYVRALQDAATVLRTMVLARDEAEAA